MTLAIEQPMFATATRTGQALLSGISWETYEAIRRETDDAGQRRYMTYDDGDLEIMSPLPKHEQVKGIIGLLLKLYAAQKCIPFASLGSTTWKRHDLRKGLEPDECFYVQSEPRMRGREDIELPKDPPPDLAIEVDITSRSINKQKIYSALGVPELWRYDGKRLEILKLVDGRYIQVDTSIAFPDLPQADLLRFIDMRLTCDEGSLINSWLELLRGK